jgi:uncharacterized protein YlzI (FlbEa/FlbD family)
MFIELKMDGEQVFLNAHRVLTLRSRLKGGASINLVGGVCIKVDNSYNVVKQKIARALNGKFLVRFKNSCGTTAKQIIISDCRENALNLFREKHDNIEILSCFEIKQEEE